MNNWQYHDSKMQELKKIYSKISKQTQNNLQEIFKTFNMTSDNIYRITDKKTKDKINTYIEEWKDKGLLKGYFGTLANNIYKRIRVKNGEILELLIYGAYIEEQNKLQETELNIFKEDANYYYQQGQEEVNNTLKDKKKVSVIPDAIFLALMDMQNAKGYIWQQYIEAIIKYNADQIYRQYLIDIQQQKEPNIDDDAYQNIIKKQQNAKLCINGDKISGAVDNQLIGINNLAKVEGISSFDNKAKCKFISIHDEKRTKMCESLDSQEFYLNDWNEFRRYSKTNDSIVKYRCHGLVAGLNCPPINDGFHYCRSYIVYLPPVEKEGKTEYNSVEYVRRNKKTDNRTLDEKIKRVKKKFPKYIQEFINNTPIQKIGKGKNNHYLNGKLYLLNDATEEEIIHEIGHIIEEKLDIANDIKYQLILKNSIGEIDVFNNSIGSIKGYDADKYEFLLTGNNFISDYQRRVYNIDINKNDRIDYMKGTFNYNVFRDYLPEGLRCYMTDKQLLKTKNIDLYKYIEEVLHERK